MAEKVLYQTVVENKEGIQGHAKVITGGDLDVLTSNPVHDTPGTNPEQLIGLALATCLNATIEAEEKRRGLSTRALSGSASRWALITPASNSGSMRRSRFPRSAMMKRLPSSKNARSVVQSPSFSRTVTTLKCTSLMTSILTKEGSHNEIPCN